MLRLGNYWYIAAPSSELKKEPIRRLVEGVVLVLFRDSAGKPHGLADRCMHRGMALSAGRVAGECVQCPYHGWQYDGDGRLRVAPALCDGERLPRGKINSYPVVEQDR